MWHSHRPAPCQHSRKPHKFAIPTTSPTSRLSTASLHAFVAAGSGYGCQCFSVAACMRRSWFRLPLDGPSPGIRLVGSDGRPPPSDAVFAPNLDRQVREFVLGLLGLGWRTRPAHIPTFARHISHTEGEVGFLCVLLSLRPQDEASSVGQPKRPNMFDSRVWIPFLMLSDDFHRSR